MDKLFRKRTQSTKDALSRQALHSTHSDHSDLSFSDQISVVKKKRKGSRDEDSQGSRDGSSSSRRTGNAPPRLDVDIRNSLMLPGLSQRFSVLLPSLSAVPETSLRSQFASQRERQAGPTITEEEEELLFAELQDIAQFKATQTRQKPDDWDGRPPLLDNTWSTTNAMLWERGGGRYPTNYSASQTSLAGSSSLPNLLDFELASPVSTTNSKGYGNGPSTSNSVDSFATFGVSDDRSPSRAKSYGFSGGSGMRDDAVMRKNRKPSNIRIPSSASSPAISPSIPTAQTTDSLASELGQISEEERRGKATRPRDISPEKANAHYWNHKKKLNGGATSPTGSDRTATPTSAIASPRLNGMGRYHSPSSSLSLQLPPPQPAPTTPLPPTPINADAGKVGRQRKSMLAGLSAAQRKRISAALLEIGHVLDLEHEAQGGEGDEELLKSDNPSDETFGEEQDMPVRASMDQSRKRSDSGPLSEESSHSNQSSVFPYHISPTAASFAPSVQPPTETNSPVVAVSTSQPVVTSIREIPTLSPPLPAIAAIIPEASRPIPTLTPTRTLPVRHNYSLSNGSSSSSSGSVVPGYIPGQPRPVRSDGTRSATPTNLSNSKTSPTVSFSSPTPPSRLRSESNPPLPPPVIASRTSSLARSKSVQQASLAFKPVFASNVVQRNNTILEPMSARSASPKAVHSPLPAEILEEGDDTDDDMEHSGEEHERTPDIALRQVKGRRSVAESKSESAISGLPPPSDRSTAAGPSSVEGQIEDGDRSGGITPSSLFDLGGHTYLTRAESSVSITSMGSSFQEDEDNEGNGKALIWDDKVLAVEAEMEDNLRMFAGIDLDAFRKLQIKLIVKAKEEREALRAAMDDSPTLPMTPIMPQTLNTTSAQQTASPLSTNENFSPSRIVRNSPVELGSILTPPQNRSQTIANARAAPLPPSNDSPQQTASDEVVTPTSKDPHGLPADQAVDDAEKVRDFEARIAAATAALNRTPSSANKFEPKNSRKNSGPMVISTPKLLSTSLRIKAKPIDSPESVDAAMSKAMENASGSKKMSKWRKLGFRKGQSITSADTFTPPSSAPLPSSKLEDPIRLQKIGEQPNSGGSDNMMSFKFPISSANTEPTAQNGTSSLPLRDLPSPPGTANPTSGLKQMMGKLRSNKSLGGQNQNQSSVDLTEPVHLSSSSISAPKQTLPHHGIDFATRARIHHTPTASNDSVVEKFIAAGRAVGLNDDQLKDMLVANEMLDRSGTIGSSRSNGSTSVITPSPVTPAAAMVLSFSPNLSEDNQPVLTRKDSSNYKGLLRKLSKKSIRGQDDSRNKIVRRTLVLPDTIPPTPLNFSATTAETPSVASRKPSVRRKPLNLSSEDQQLVADSPPPSSHMRNFSSSSAHSTPPLVLASSENAGLGFLHPNGEGMLKVLSSESDEARNRGSAVSGGGGSLYDLYAQDEEEIARFSKLAENLPPPARKKGIAITEYEDGRMAWSVIDALREAEDTPNLSDYSDYGTHSRQTSFASSMRDNHQNQDDGVERLNSATAALNLRHRDRGPEQPRPETNLYFTSPTDIGDLIDQLSRDPSGSKGRIDFLPPSPNPAFGGFDIPPLPTKTAPGQFEDAPSPRKTPPAPINVPRSHNVPAGGFSPKRQLFVKQNFGKSAINGSGSVGGQGNGIGHASSPSAASFGSSLSGRQPVEDKLQALMDRLVKSGAVREDEM